MGAIIMNVKISLLHTNDLHSNFNEWIKLASIIKKQRLELESKGNSVILIDGGDHFDVSVPECATTQGRLNIQMLNELKFDVLGVGNNELARFSPKHLSELITVSYAPWLLANVLHQNGNQIGNTKSNHIIKTKEGIKIGFIGITDQLGTLYEDSFGYKNKDTSKIVKNLSNELRKEGVNIVILVSHCGFDQDITLANELNEFVDVIIGAHSHTILHQPEIIEGVIIVQAGSHGDYLGELTLEYNPLTKKIVSYDAILHENELLVQKDKNQEKILFKGKEETEAFLNKEVLFLEKALQHQELVSWLAKVMKDYYKAEIGLMIGAAAKEGLPVGRISIRDIYNVCASLICTAHLEMKGSQIIGLLQERLDPKITTRVVGGYGFRPRGIQIGKIEFSGVTWEELDGRIFNIKVNGTNIDKNRWYKIGTGEHLHIVKACGYPSLVGTRVIEVNDFLYVRDVLITSLLENVKVVN
ncbi:hypothetical protein BK699_19925 [Bacillus thuringiensis serovar mexicanensis]|uniref:Bifunctional metallophosphatase/5'-nucleotidase n=2 Tax=Bacillus cereus group TaxID=86661 RepID=A0A2C9YER0_BACTU|nr:hypothetical protein bthur0007_64010 [Bacillus thuringiensis serovar monterrey BGSC 4AJ1]OTW46527.1 hypothetical protein BK699_19925 [Bacillus thuringiensis serovar mexicanensis]OTX06258.1 hypothetical protein BK705_10860 [Bacillus thuringiensis serovar monterrey]QKE10559.1 bifunctional metallophosphatase/5'-nucleotidase [Bacillus cereus]